MEATFPVEEVGAHHGKDNGNIPEVGKLAAN